MGFRAVADKVLGGFSAIFSALTVNGNSTLGLGDFSSTTTVNGALNVVGAPVTSANGGFVAGNNVGLIWNGDGTKGITFDTAGNLKISLPTSSAGLAAGTLWNDGGTVKVVV